jgi:hypothetical protein
MSADAAMGSEDHLDEDSPGLTLNGTDLGRK